MTKPDNAWPPGLVEMREAKRAVYEALTPESRAEVDLWQKAYRIERSAAKAQQKAARNERLGYVIRMWGEGVAVPEIAMSVDRSTRLVEGILKDFGLKGLYSLEKRWRRFWISDENDKSLHRLAHDAGLSIPEMLREMGEHLLRDDALIARRVMRVTRKAPVP